MLTQTEENYLKAIYHIWGSKKEIVNTNALADAISTSAASATDMIQRLSKKGLVNYHPYKGVSPTVQGEKEAINTIRKHRLWEVFLVQKLKFKWDEVHEVAEQLEHVESPMLVEYLDKYLGHPRFDPHGDPIPNAKGEIEPAPSVTLGMLQPGEECRVISAKDSSASFLNYLDKIQISLGAHICIQDLFDFDESFTVSIDSGPSQSISKKAADNIFVEKT